MFLNWFVQFSDSRSNNFAAARIFCFSFESVAVEVQGLEVKGLKDFKRFKAI